MPDVGVRRGTAPVSPARKEGLADVHGRFSAASDSARDLQHHRLPDARRFACRADREADADVRRGMAADAERYPAGAGHRAAAVRGHQGRASRREISHRSSAVADRVRRAPPPNSCCGRGSAPRPISCSRCWRWWISCPASRCARGAVRLSRRCRFSRKSARTAAPVVPSRNSIPPPIPAPAPMPAPPPAMPAAHSIAKSVLLDHPEPSLAQQPSLARRPSLAQPAVTPAAASPAEPAPAASSPEVASPDLQPGNGVTPPETPKH